MALEGKPLSEMTEADLLSLQENAVTEGKAIDYKLEVGSTRNARKEFLKDASSFANTAGGHLLIGVEEGPPGLPAAFPGLAIEVTDAEKNRLENLLRDCVIPRLRGVEMLAVPIGDGARAVVIVRVPRSMTQPHVVDFDGHWRFYARNSAGAFQLDVEQLRVAFLAGDAEAQRVREFRTLRVASLMAGELPVRLRSEDMLVAHLIPASASDPAHRVDAGRLRRALEKRLAPVGVLETTHRHNLDGLLIHAPASEDGSILGYLQLFASGTIESARADPLNVAQTGELALATGAVQSWLWDAVPTYLDFMASQLESDFPVVLMVSLLGVGGARLATRRRWDGLDGHPIDRPNLLFPEVIIDDPKAPPGEYLRPIFDSLWNAGGYVECRDIEHDGSLWQLS